MQTADGCHTNDQCYSLLHHAVVLRGHAHYQPILSAWHMFSATRSGPLGRSNSRQTGKCASSLLRLLTKTVILYAQSQHVTALRAARYTWHCSV